MYQGAAQVPLIFAGTSKKSEMFFSLYVPMLKMLNILLQLLKIKCTAWGNSLASGLTFSHQNQ